ncbi:hypothetical protein LUZ60_011058 [Juncus effusus]|nr:hypothetical protein LUZ60_011058 [Juncus effusus]
MPKVYPNAIAPAGDSQRSQINCENDQQEAHVLTVWRKSLMFNCNGFTVFDSKGNLVFRVDNYASEHKGEIVLMDASGKSVLTIRRKKLSLSDQWLMYNEEESSKPLFSIKKHVALRPAKTLIHLTPCTASSTSITYHVDGSYYHRNCMIYNQKQQPVAEIRRKESKAGVQLGADVFKLVIQSEFDTYLAMAVVIVMDQMFGSKPSLLRNWSF